MYNLIDNKSTFTFADALAFVDGELALAAQSRSGSNNPRNRNLQKSTGRRLELV